MDMSSAPKRRRTEPTVQSKLAKVVCVRNVSLSAVRQVLNLVSDEQVSRRQLQASHHQRYEEVKRTMTLPASEGSGNVTINMSDPIKLLTLLLRENQHLRRWFEAAWRASPSSPTRPWRLLVGWDEFVPGNKLAIQNTRKTMVLSFSFLELGHYLGRDAAWITPLAVRSSLVQQVRGRWAAMLRSFLRLLLLGAEGLHSSGYPIVIGGNTYLLHAKMHTLLSDGDGLRQALEWMGASALKPCFRHWNVFRPSADLADRCSSSRQYVTTACTDMSAFRTWTNADLQQASAVLILAKQRHASGEIPYARVEEIQQAYGYKFSADR